MPTIVNAQRAAAQQGRGWTRTPVVGSAALGTPAMEAQRWSLRGHAQGPIQTHTQGERMLYVIAGSGLTLIGSERAALAPETVVWLEPGDRYQLEAGPAGLEVLEAAAPARGG
jgi:quercetin dioxygenase-like cupin family protein